MVTPYNGKELDDSLVAIYLIVVLLFASAPFIMVCMCLIREWCFVDLKESENVIQSTTEDMNNPLRKEKLASEFLKTQVIKGK